MYDFSDPRAVADRLRIASSALSHPHDLAIARQYVYELQALVWGLQQEERWGESEKAAAEYHNGTSALEPDPARITMPEGAGSTDENQSSVFDYFEVDDRPVIVDRSEGVAWQWSRGRWRQTPHLVEKSYKAGAQLGADAFVRAYPYAALELLDSRKGPSHS